VEPGRGPHGERGAGRKAAVNRRQEHEGIIARARPHVLAGAGAAPARALELLPRQTSLLRLGDRERADRQLSGGTIALRAMRGTMRQPRPPRNLTR
jgi:hypothetical protein